MFASTKSSTLSSPLFSLRRTSSISKPNLFNLVPMKATPLRNLSVSSSFQSQNGSPQKSSIQVIPYSFSLCFSFIIKILLWCFESWTRISLMFPARTWLSLTCLQCLIISIIKKNRILILGCVRLMLIVMINLRSCCLYFSVVVWINSHFSISQLLMWFFSVWRGVKLFSGECWKICNLCTWTGTLLQRPYWTLFTLLITTPYAMIILLSGHLGCLILLLYLISFWTGFQIAVHIITLHLSAIPRRSGIGNCNLKPCFST